MTKKVLYISYDGMTDPLGQSQVLPYLKGLTRYGYQFTILSFEKKERFEKTGAIIREIMKETGIEWVHLFFSTRPPVLSKMYDLFQLRRKAVELQRKHGFDIVHCRSYVAAGAGLMLKRRFGVKMLFDMRGFWPDEKKEGGGWDISNPIFRQVYRHYKKQEADFLKHADAIVSLTHEGKKVLTSWPAYNRQVPVSVIPCCADMNLFTVTSDPQKNESRKLLSLPADVLILSYLGSLGSWYMLDEMLELFSVIRKKYPDALFLFVTLSDKQLILDRLAHHHLPADAVRIMSADRKNVPTYIKASDINISFIKPVFSKKASSPTKLGEVMAMGIPSIVNAGVGDVESIVQGAGAGYVINDFDRENFEKAADAIPALLKSHPSTIREEGEKIFSLEHGVESYRRCYEQILGNK